MENEHDDTDILTSEEEVVTNEESTEPEETIEDLRTRLEEERQARTKAEEKYENQKIRAEKAERKSEVAPKSSNQTSKQTDLSFKDSYALQDAKVPYEDVDEVVKYAKYANISIADALKSNVVKAILKDNAEMRNVAQATNTGPARRTSGKVSDDALLDKASRGEMPDSDDEIERLVAARRNRK